MSIGTAAKVALGGLNAWGTYSQYKYEKEKGYSAVGAVGKIAIESALFAFAPAVGGALFAGQILAGGVTGMGAYAQGAGRQNAQAMNDVYRNSLAGNFVDSENANTLRQRGMQAISHSQNNLNAVFGNEARSFYRGMR